MWWVVWAYDDLLMTGEGDGGDGWGSASEGYTDAGLSRDDLVASRAANRERRQT